MKPFYSWVAKTKERVLAAQSKAKNLTRIQAQKRMYELTAERDALQKTIERLKDQHDILLEESRALLENYSTLRFREGA